MKRVVVAFGTRPEANKMVPVVFALRALGGVQGAILTTGQHREQLDSTLELFGLRPDIDLNVMTQRQTLPALTSRIVEAAATALRDLQADYVLVHGDTLTTFCVALAAFFERVPVGHVEAGLRSHDLQEPFPEEALRCLTDVVTDLALAPTPDAKKNLLRENKAPHSILVTGQTAVDGVRLASERAALPSFIARAQQQRRLVTVTMHRRENWPLLRALAGTLKDVAEHHQDCFFVYPVHLNPVVREAVTPVLTGLPNVILCDPLPYGEMAALIRDSVLLVTDSGGLQEEGASLNVPVAVLRNVTERPEGVAAGAVQLVGTEPEAVEKRITHLLTDPAALEAMRHRPNPFGDGRASVRVAQAVAWRMGLGPRPDEWVGLARA